ncbi:protein BIG GRAIN 1-like C [Punica granatum]|uniref:Protein BIG GRAIN 1-like C n=1 Tax=Punica granatum TaxID=22663 RepID=A0A6P8C971_PUNGR|nr:protein BIG GRAIN 1-like C [Punica granatum]
MYKRERPPTIPQRRKTPSFSSSLLDAIYRSIDEPSPPEDKDSGFYAGAPRVKKQSSCEIAGDKQGRPRPSPSFSSHSSPSSTLRRAILIEEWMEKQSTLHCNVSLNSASISSSSDSSSGATFSSSSEAEFSRRSCKSSKSRPKQADPFFEPRNLDAPNKKVLHCDDGDGNNGVAGGFKKTKLRALKIYGELKNLKQPISPGGRISSFLNSIFSSGNVKKAKMCYVGAVEDVSFERKSKSACSSASSFSRRSCMTKSQTPNYSSSSSSSFPGRNKTKRSVRFYPVSVIVGEDARPCGHKPVYEEDPTLIVPLSDSRSRRFQDVVKKNSYSSATRDRGFRARFEEYDDEDDDVESCASSDLFELDHLIGIGRYREELPVYETTCLKMNQAIASGMKL